MTFRQIPRKIKKYHIPEESFRVWKFVKDREYLKRGIPTTRRGKWDIVSNPKRLGKYDGHYITRAYTKEGQFYECITFNHPSVAVLETSVTKWGNSLGKVTNLEETYNELIRAGWKLVSRDKLERQKQLRLRDLEFVKEDLTESDYKLAVKAEENKERAKEIIDLPKNKSFNWYSQDEELQRALEFQRIEREKWEAKNRKKRKDERN